MPSAPALPLFVGNTHAFCRAAGPGREDPQPDTDPSQLVKRGRLCDELRKEAESKKAPLEVGLGGEPATLTENSWGGWGGTSC